MGPVRVYTPKACIRVLITFLEVGPSDLQSSLREDVVFPEGRQSSRREDRSSSGGPIVPSGQWYVCTPRRGVHTYLCTSTPPRGGGRTVYYMCIFSLVVGSSHPSGDNTPFGRMYVHRPLRGLCTYTGPFGARAPVSQVPLAQIRGHTGCACA